MAEFVGNMQSQIKKTSSDLVLFSIKLASGAILGLTLALIIQELLGHVDGEDLLAVIFGVVTTTAVFLRVSKAWSLTAVLIFDLVCVLVGMVLRLYVMVAPGL